jgi:lysyl-tRNA synthetase class 2
MDLTGISIDGRRVTHGRNAALPRLAGTSRIYRMILADRLAIGKRRTVNPPNVLRTDTLSSGNLQPNIGSLRQRAAMLQEMRSFFDARGFCEVQPPCLSRDCVVDAHLDSLAVDSRQMAISVSGLPQTFYLQTSPESAMKRMMAAGAPSIYSIGPVFRAGERGDFHNPEFTMLEWYQLGAEMDAGVRLLGELAIELLDHDRYDVRRYRDVFEEAFRVDPIGAELSQIAALAAEVDPHLASSIADDFDSMLDLLFSKSIQPHLGVDRPLILTHYPLSQAALAKPASDDPACAARFELFADGIELANGYDELRDPQVLVDRYQQNQKWRVSSGKSPMPLDTTLAEAMRTGLPQCTGVAMGVDRMLMARIGSRSIDDVIPLTIERA